MLTKFIETTKKQLALLEKQLAELNEDTFVICLASSHQFFYGGNLNELHDAGLPLPSSLPRNFGFAFDLKHLKRYSRDEVNDVLVKASAETSAALVQLPTRVWLEERLKEFQAIFLSGRVALVEATGNYSRKLH